MQAARLHRTYFAINASKIEGEHKNGVLMLRLPKQVSLKPKQVQVRAQA